MTLATVLPFKRLVSLDEARELLTRALKREPSLTAFGFGIYGREGKEPAKYAEELAKERAELSSDARLFEIAGCAEWIRLQQVSKHFNKRRSSYGLKHTVERWLDGYVSNGSFLAAAIGLGADYRPDGPNAQFKFTEKSVRRFEVRP